LGFVYPYLGEFDRYAAMLRSLGDSLTDIEVRAFTRRLRGEHALSIGDFKELASRTPWQDVLLNEAGQAQLGAHQNQNAADTFRRVLALYPNVTAPGLGLTVAVRQRARHGLVVVLERLGQLRALADVAE